MEYTTNNIFLITDIHKKYKEAGFDGSILWSKGGEVIREDSYVPASTRDLLKVLGNG